MALVEEIAERVNDEIRRFFGHEMAGGQCLSANVRRVLLSTRR
jgi:hypothetical protein